MPATASNSRTLGILVLVLGLATAALPAQPSLRHRFDGPSSGEFQGVAVDGVHDVNADGWPDLAVGASGESTAGLYAGSVRIYSGHDGALLAAVHGSAPFDEFGYAVAAVGDVNLDGYADVLCGAIGASGNGTASGSVSVLSGEWVAKTALGQTPLTPQFLRVHHGDAAGDNFGLVVAAAGDVDRDGYPDYVVGAPRDDDNGTSSGSIRIFSGQTGVALATFFGDAAFDQLGHACAGVGDINGDGWPEVAGGAFLADASGPNAGRVKIYSGEWIAQTAATLTPNTPAVLGIFDGDAPGDRMGLWVAAAGDLDADGFADVVVGAPSASYSAAAAGSVYVFSGEWVARTSAGLSPQTSRVAFRFDGAAAGDNLGTCCGGAVDVDADGVPDVFGGAQFNDQSGSNAGSVAVWSGANGALLATWYGPSAGANFGIHVNSAGDVNLDGFDELIVGAPFAAPNGTDSGTAVVRSVAAGHVYEMGLGGFHGLGFEWITGNAPGRHDGIVRLSGATPGALGVILVSSAPDSTEILPGLRVLVDLGPSYLGFIPIAFDQGGEVAFAVDLKEPALAGVAFYLQGAETSPNLSASNGLLLLFCP